MKKISMKFMALGIVLGILGTTGAVLAKSVLTTIQVSLDPIQMKINGQTLPGDGKYFNGQEVVPTSMIYKGTTYVPVRLAAESFGYQVDWDGNNRLISFENNTSPVKEIVAGKLESTISHTTNKDGSVDFKFVVKNQTEQPVTLNFNNGQRFNYEIRNEDGNVVKRYDIDKLFIAALGKKVLVQGEEWVLKDQLHDLAKGKTYTMDFWITSNEYHEKQTYTFTLE